MSPEEQEQFSPGAVEENCNYPEDFSVQMIRGNVRALITSNALATTVEWLEPTFVSDPDLRSSLNFPTAILITVQGPAEELTVEEALKLANMM